ncbi:MAG: hypothetical protein HUJ56_09130, partial [Erysipelotrichaceae bacterium]|nr:hypothetical protein [Erysipelotrichaceae bacterium]
MFDWFWTPAELLPDGVGFNLYGIEHLTWLFVLTLMIIGMIRLYVKLDTHKRRTMCRIIA